MIENAIMRDENIKIEKDNDGKRPEGITIKKRVRFSWTDATHKDINKCTECFLFDAHIWGKFRIRRPHFFHISHCYCEFHFLATIITQKCLTYFSIE